MIKYKTRNKTDIEAVDVVRETEKCVFVPSVSWGRKWDGKSVSREAKISEYSRYHDTWEEAHVYLLNKLDMRTELLRQRLESAEYDLSYVRAMTKPEGE